MPKIEYRKYNFKTTSGRRRKMTIQFAPNLHRELVKYAKNQEMSLSWFMEEMAEITIGVLVDIVKNENTKKARYTNRQN